MLSMIMAVADDGAIGKNGTMPWHLAGDLKHFKKVTLGHPMIMGRKTFESLGGVLPKREHIVVTANPFYTYDHPRVRIAHDIDEVLSLAKESETEYMVIGGRSICEMAMPLCDRLYLTHVHASFPDADTFLPLPDLSSYDILDRSELMTDPESGLSYEFITYQKMSNEHEEAIDAV